MYALMFNNVVLELHETAFPVVSEEGMVYKWLSTTTYPLVEEDMIFNSTDDVFYSHRVGDTVYAKQLTDGVYEDYIVEDDSDIPVTHTLQVRLESSMWDETTLSWLVNTDMQKAKLKEDLAILRVEKQNLNLTINDVELSTLQSDRQEMQHYVTESGINGNPFVNWKLPNKEYEIYPTENFKEVYKAIVLYINDCFGREHQLIHAIETATDLTTVDITVGWASTDITVTFPVV